MYGPETLRAISRRLCVPSNVWVVRANAVYGLGLGLGRRVRVRVRVRVSLIDITDG